MSGVDNLVEILIPIFQDLIKHDLGNNVHAGSDDKLRTRFAI